MSYQNTRRMELVRKAVQKGRFYPAEANDILKMIRHWELILEQNGLDQVEITPEAIVSPHAGYIYSGFTANTAHRLMPHKNPQTVVVIGPSHYVYIPGMSLGPFKWYETPFGFVEGDLVLAEDLSGRFDFVYEPGAHQREHSTEVQFPFIAHYMPQARILEIIYGDVHPDKLREVIDYLLSIPGVGVVVSTDLSHYYPAEKAKILDSYCINATQKIDPLLLESGCEACGKTGLEAMLLSARDLQLKSRVLDYRTSGDVTGDYSSVVGYMSAAFYK